MQKNPYLVLQTYESASESEVDFAYERLKKQYSEDRFLSGDAGAEAARKLTELEDAYRDVKQKFASSRFDSEGSVKGFGEIEELLKQNKNSEAQARLDELTNRNAEWHYLQSIVFYKKSWYEESRYQLEMAVSMDSSNTKYKEALNRLNVFMSGQAGNKSNDNNTNFTKPDAQYNPNNNNQSNNRNNFNNNNNYNDRQNRDMGCCGSNDTNATNCCTQLICADCCCECMGGDLLLCC